LTHNSTCTPPEVFFPHFKVKRGFQGIYVIFNSNGTEALVRQNNKFNDFIYCT